jgi:transcriptional antiterminator RfaH
VNPRASKTRPYFPGYLFVQADLSVVGQAEFRWMPYARGLVCFGEDPAPVPESLVHSLWKKVGSLNAEEVEFGLRLRSGDQVVIRDGPFTGYEAVFDTRIPGQDRVRVLLCLLRDRYVALELNEAFLERPPAR